MTRHKLPIHLRTVDLRRRLFERFDDGEWHNVREAAEVARGIIKPEQAFRSSAAAGHRQPSIDKGLRRLVGMALAGEWIDMERRIGPPLLGGPKRLSREFRIVPGQQLAPPRRRLDEQTVIDIKVRLSAGDTRAAIAKDFGVSQSTVASIARRKTHAGVPFVPVTPTEKKSKEPMPSLSGPKDAEIVVSTIIPLSLIRVPTNRLRPLDEDAVADLVESILERGLLHPIVVRPSGEGYELIAGGRRLEACRQISAVDILARVMDLDDNDARLTEVDENLVRKELTALERADHLAERKRVYLLKYPETKHGTAGALASNAVQGKGDAVAMVATASPSFVADTAAKTGLSTRTIERDVQISESIPDDVRTQVLGTPVAKSVTQLTALAALDHDAQREVVTTTDLTNSAVLKAAISSRRPAPEPKGKPRERIRRPHAIHGADPVPPALARFVAIFGAVEAFCKTPLAEVVACLGDEHVALYRRTSTRLRIQMDRLDDALAPDDREDEATQAATDAPSEARDAPAAPEAEEDASGLQEAQTAD